MNSATYVNEFSSVFLLSHCMQISLSSEGFSTLTPQLVKMIFKIGEGIKYVLKSALSCVPYFVEVKQPIKRAIHFGNNCQNYLPSSEPTR